MLRGLLSSILLAVISMNSATTVGVVFALAWFIFALPTAVFLLRAYLRSKMSSFLWMFIALSVWPFTARILTVAVGAAGSLLGASQGLTLGPLQLPGYLVMPVIEELVGGALLLFSVILLDRELTARLLPARIAPQPARSALPAAPPPPVQAP